MSPDPARIVAALDVLLTAAITDDLAMAPAAGPFRTEGDDFAALVEQPIGTAYRIALVRIGEHVASAAAYPEDVRDIGEAAADQDPARYGRRLAILEAAWAHVTGECFGWRK